jgi:peptide/nickel transport system substrate-binding protein
MVRRLSFSNTVIALAVLASLLTSIPLNAHAQEVRRGPYLDEVTFIHYLDENVAVNEVKAGNIDTYFWRVPLDIVQELKNNPNVKVYEAPGGSLSLLLNPAPAEQDNLNPFAFKEVRYAMNYLINRDNIVNEVLKGFGAPMYSAFSQYDPDYIVLADVIESFGFKYNPKLAEDIISRVLTDAGAQKSSDGKWLYKGKQIELKFFIRGDDPRRKTIGEIIASDLERLGFKVERIYGDLNKAFSDVYGSDPKEFKWHLYTEGWGRSALDRYDSSLAAQMYAPWFANMPGFRNPDYWNYEHKELDEVTEKIFTGNYRSKDERDTLLKRAVTLGVNESVRIFIANTLDPYIVRGNVKGVVLDFGAGITGRFTLINASNESNSLKVGMKQIYQGAWNPVSGLRDYYATRVWSAIADPATFRNPHTGDVIPVRATWDVYTAGPDGSVDVPSNAIVWDPYGEQWKEVGSNVKAKSKVTFDLRYSRWHNGIMMDKNDILYALYFAFEWGTKESEDDPTYDPEYTATAEKFIQTLKGVRFLDDHRLEVYVDYWHFDPNYIADYASLWASMPWEVYAAMEKVVTDGNAEFSQSAAKANNVEWLSLIIKEHANMIKDALTQFKNNNTIPKALQGMVSMQDANARYDATIRWIDSKGHAVISNGPFYLDSYNPDARTIVIKAFRDNTYPFEQGHWSIFEHVRLAEIKSVNAPISFTRGGEELVIKGNVSVEGDPSKDVNIYYFIKDKDGKVVKQGSVKPNTDGSFTIRLDKDDTYMLSLGSNEVKILAVSNLALKPEFYTTSIIGIGEPTVNLIAKSTSGKYNVTVEWLPADIGKESVFKIGITDSSNNTLSNAVFDLILYSNGKEVHRLDRVNSNSISKLILNEQGNYVLEVRSINGEQGEDVSISFNYVPEFPLVYYLVLGVSLMVALIALRGSRIIFNNSLR